jgi:NitT/TauT family transport system substrate-binding protein
MWWGDYTILVAEELGLFEKYNVEVESVYYETFSEALPSLAAGTIDGGLFALDDAINTNEQTPVKITAVYDDGGFSYVVGSGDILQPADLKGKRIGVNVGSIGELFIIEALKQGGLTMKDVSIVDVEVEEVPDSLGKTIDAGYVWDPYASDLLAEGAALLLKSGGTQSITPDVIVFRSDVVEQRPDDVRAFLKAWFEAVEYRKTNPEETNKIISAKMGIPVADISEDSLIFSTSENKTLFSGQSTQTMISLKDALLANIEFLIRIGALSKVPDIERLMEPSYLP